MAIKTDINQKLVEQVFAMYTNAELEALAKVAKAVKSDTNFEGWASVKANDLSNMKNEIQTLMNETGKSAKDKMSDSVVKAYLGGVNSAEKDMEFPLTALESLSIPANIQALVLHMNNMHTNATFQVLRSSEDMYRKVIAETSSGVLLGLETRQQASQRALNKLAASGITTFVDKANRKWDIASYVEMATRTSTAQAALQGHLDRQSQLGNDLVKVSAIGTTCPLCAPWQGKVLTISGTTAGYPTLDSAKAAGLFHPNCKHTITAYIPGISEPPQDVQNDAGLYEKTQQQRYNERQIRKWKKIQAVSFDPTAHKRAQLKILEWQGRQQDLIKGSGLRRNYARESIRSRTGNAKKATASLLNPIKTMAKDDTKQALSQFNKVKQYDLNAKLKKQAAGVPSPTKPPTPKPVPVPAKSWYADHIGDKNALEIAYNNKYDEMVAAGAKLKELIDLNDEYLFVKKLHVVTPKIPAVPVPKTPSKRWWSGATTLNELNIAKGVEYDKMLLKSLSPSELSAVQVKFQAEYSRLANAFNKQNVVDLDEFVKQSKAKPVPSIKRTATKSTAKPKPAPKPKKGKYNYDFSNDGMPDAGDLSYSRNGASLGGAGKKDIYIDADGNEYIFKPALTKSGQPAEYKAYAQEAAYKLQSFLRPDITHPVKSMTLGGQKGTLQRMIKDIDNNATNNFRDITHLSKSEMKNSLAMKNAGQMQREHAIDWLLGNFDSHEKNFTVLKDGTIMGLDKEQTFRYLMTEQQSKTMSTSYHPNSKYGENPPVYNKFFETYKSLPTDEAEAMLEETRKIIVDVEAISDVEYAEMFRPYVESLHPGIGYGATTVRADLSKEILKRKVSLRADFEKFYSELESVRSGSPTSVTFDKGKVKKVVQKAPPVVKPKKVSIGNIKPADYVDYSAKYKNYEISNKRGLNSLIPDVVTESKAVLNLPDDQRRALKAYSGSSYQSINKHLRHGGGSGDTRATVTNMKEAFKNPMLPKLSQDTMLYRHTDTNPLSHMFGNDIADEIETMISNFKRGHYSKADLKKDMLKKKLIGGTFSDKAFMSTSTQSEVFVDSSGLELRIYLPKGSKHGIFIEEISSHSSETEYLLNAGLNMRIFDVDVKKVGSYSTNAVLHVVVE